MKGKRSKKKECGEKRAFETLEAAEAAAKGPKKWRMTGFMTAYRCRWCSKYHYGHTNKL
jgi:hypothetical protein